MDKDTMKHICLNLSILKKYFCGILPMEYVRMRKLSLLKKNGDFVILNIGNEHWFVVQRHAKDRIYIFDSIGGIMLPPDLKSICSNLLSIDHKLNKLFYDFPKRALQDTNALTCGEHCIVYLIRKCYHTSHRSFEEGNYSHSLLEYCQKHSISPDECVWREVYYIWKLAKVPNLRQVVEWYCEEI